MISDPDLVAFSGDWHGDSGWAVRAIEAAALNGCQALIQVGDHGFNFAANFVKNVRHACDDFDIDVLFIKGNHDNPYLLEKWPLDDQGFGHSPFGGRGSERYHFIPQGHRWQWWGLTWMGLGGAHSVDRPWRTPMVDWWPDEWISTADMYHAIQGGKVHIMATHDLPAEARLPNERKSEGWPEAELAASLQHRLLIQSVVDEVQPELLVHGHFHQRFEQQVGGMHVVGLDMNQSTLAKNLYIIGPDLIERTYRTPQPADYPSDPQERVRERIADLKARKEARDGNAE